MDKQTTLHSDDEKTFLDTLNKRGFILEYKTYKILQSLAGTHLKRNFILDYGEKRIEIDIFFVYNKLAFIFECKRTDYTWVFAKAFERQDILHLISAPASGLCTVTSRPTKNFITVENGIGMLFNDNKRLKIPNNERLAKTESNDHNLHSNIKQVLNETSAYLSHTDQQDGLVVPVIVTNTDLFVLTFSGHHIDKKGDLQGYNNIKIVPYLAYSFPEFLKYQRPWGIECEPLSEDHNLKTVFIVNINHLGEFVRIVSELSPDSKTDTVLAL